MEVNIETADNIRIWTAHLMKYFIYDTFPEAGSFNEK